MSAIAGAPSARRARAARGILGRALASVDARVIAGLALLFVALTALTWRKWGVPEIDAGSELTTAQRVADGAVAYRDVRYFYGPAGLYSLAGAFGLFGASFTTAFAFGLAQAAAILAAFYALARSFLPALTAGIATAIVATIGFSGTAFNFVLPHTNSATFGILFLLLMLLALSRERIVLAGVLAGIVGLTRPEFAAVAAFAGAAYLVGVAREDGIRPALRALVRLALPALGVAGAVLGAFAAKVGASNLFTENLWPVDFLRVSNFGSQGNWAPFDAASVVATAARAAVYCSLLAGLVAAAEGFTRRSGRRRALGLWPLAAAVGGLAVGALAWRASGAFGIERLAVEDETRHLLIGMTWLPALGFGVAAWALVRFLRRGAPPFSASWGVDLALIASAAALGLRAYDAFATEQSYAPYYAAPLVLVLALVHQRIADRRPEAKAAVLVALAAVAVGLGSYALIALYADDTAPVRTAAGTFYTTPEAARAFQPTLDYLARTTTRQERILAAPLDAGLYFMSERRPALYNLQFLPGLLDSVADERAAVAALHAQHVRIAVVGQRTFPGYGFRGFGVDYNRLLSRFIRARGPPVATFGSPARSAGGTNPTRTYRLYRLAP